MRSIPLQKLIIVSVAFSLMISALMGLFSWFSWNINRSEVLIRNIKSKLIALEEERKFARTARAFLKEREPDLKRIDQFAIDRERPVEFIEALENLARKTSNTLALEFDEGRSTAKHLSFRMTLQGEEENAHRYLKLLELLPYFIRIEELRVRRTVRQTPSGTQGTKTVRFADTTLTFTVLSSL